MLLGLILISLVIAINKEMILISIGAKLIIAIGITLSFVSGMYILFELGSNNFYYTEKDMKTGELFKLLFKSKPYRVSKFIRKHISHIEDIKTGKRYYCITDKEIDAEVGSYFTKVEIETVPDSNGVTNKTPQFRKVELAA